MDVRLTGLPVELALRLARHDEELLRAYELHCSASSPGLRQTARLGDAARARQLIADAVERAQATAAAGPPRSTVDVDLDVPAVDLTSFAALIDVLGDAERLAADGTLLSRPSAVEVVALREWAIGEVLARVSGGTPVAWPHRRR